MLAVRIVRVLVTLLSFPLLPVALVTTNLIGLLGAVTALLLIPFIVPALVLTGLLLATSWLYRLADSLTYAPLVFIARLPICLIGIPTAVLTFLYGSLLPDYGDKYARIRGAVAARVWPYSLEAIRLPYAEEIPDDEAAQEKRRKVRMAADAAGISEVQWLTAFGV